MLLDRAAGFAATAEGGIDSRKRGLRVAVAVGGLVAAGRERREPTPSPVGHFLGGVIAGLAIAPRPAARWSIQRAAVRFHQSS